MNDELAELRKVQKKAEVRSETRNLEAISNVWGLAIWLEDNGVMQYDAGNLLKELQLLKDAYLLKPNKENI